MTRFSLFVLGFFYFLFFFFSDEALTTNSTRRGRGGIAAVVGVRARRAFAVYCVRGRVAASRPARATDLVSRPRQQCDGVGGAHRNRSSAVELAPPREPFRVFTGFFFFVRLCDFIIAVRLF